MINNSQPLVSVVTPVYNEEEYLAECIESVLAQSYQNWDYTIVNNCSTDRSLEIARTYAAKEPRIRVHDNQRFLEMLANHNVAVRQISPASKYCKVVLGDDWIFADCLEKMVAVAEAHPSVGVVSAYEQFGQQVRLTGLPDEKAVVAGRDACRHFLLGDVLLFGSQTSVLYRADLVRSRSPFYVETDTYADFESCFALLKTTDLGFVHQVLTFSRPRARSIGAISADIGTHFRSVLGLLFTYGRDCLTTVEFDKCLDEHLSQYYTFLGRRLWLERDRAFWSYHKNTFADLEISFSRTRLAKTALRQLFQAAVDAETSLATIRRLVSLRQIRNWQTRRVILEPAVDRTVAHAQSEGGHQPNRSAERDRCET
ncbi:MAG TPA: glycosyltransferase family A protein [Alloacidobacterium sp.]|nr:glycosyltransferase family A protein [Alloacidobacterium sp.]